MSNFNSKLTTNKLKPRPLKLNYKQRLLANKLLAINFKPTTSNLTEVKTSSGYSSNTSLNQITKTNSFNLLLDSVGLTDERLAQTFNQGLIADKPLVIDKTIHSYPDHNTRHKYLETALKVKKHLTNDSYNLLANNLLAQDFDVYLNESREEDKNPKTP